MQHSHSFVDCSLALNSSTYSIPMASVTTDVYGLHVDPQDDRPLGLLNRHALERLRVWVSHSVVRCDLLSPPAGSTSIWSSTIVTGQPVGAIAFTRRGPTHGLPSIVRQFLAGRSP